MDFNKFDARAAADEGRPLHVRHPVTGLPMYDDDDDASHDNGKPCIVYVRGAEGKETQTLIHAALEEIRGSEPEPENGGKKRRSAEDTHREVVALSKPLITGFENIHRGDKEAVAPKDCEWFLNLQMSRDQFDGRTGRALEGLSFGEQVLAFAQERANFLGNGKGSL